MTLKSYIKNKKENSYILSNISINIDSEESKIPGFKRAIEISLKKIPPHLLSNVKNINIGKKEIFDKRKIQGIYRNGTICLTDEHQKTSDMIDDLVHEIAHSVEDAHWDVIYSDGLIEKEFLRKRKELWLILKNKGFEKELDFFMQTRYIKEFDYYLYAEVGYPMMRAVTSNIFYSPYAATSIREYFSNGFEAFYMKEEIPKLKAISPEVYRKNVVLLGMGEKK